MYPAADSAQYAEKEAALVGANYIGHGNRLNAGLAHGAGSLNASAVNQSRPQTITESLIRELDGIIEQLTFANNRTTNVVDRLIGPVPENPGKGEIGVDSGMPIFTIALHQRIVQLRKEASRAHSIADRYEQVA